MYVCMYVYIMGAEQCIDKLFENHQSPLRQRINRREKDMEIGLALLLAFLPLLWWCLSRWNEMRHVLPVKARRFLTSGTRLPPGHMGFPFVGEMLTFFWYFKILRRPDDFINSKRNKYGDNVGLYRSHLFGSPSIIACSPSTNKFLFQSNESKFILEWPTPEVVGFNSIIALQGPRHDHLRRFLITAINRPDSLRRIALHVQPRLVGALQLWAKKGKINTYHELKQVVFESLGKYFVNFEPGPRLDALEQMFFGLSDGFRAQPSKIPGTAYHRAIQCRKKIVEILAEELKKRRRNNNGNAENKKNADLMDGFMQTKDEEGKELSDEEVLDNIVSLLYTGYHSIANMVTWSLHYLAKYPHVLQKLREENMEIRKDKGRDYLITHEELQRLKYTNKVVEETIRMANLSAFVFRTATQDVEFEGYLIPKGWKVILWIRYLHTNPENFEDPMCFNPDRWDTPPKPGTYLVFGAGSRHCPGNMLVRLHVALFLHHLAAGYRWELLNPDEKTTYLSHPVPADGLPISIAKI